MLGSYTQIMILYNQKLEQEMERNRYARELRKPRKERPKRVPALSQRASQCACTPAPTCGVQNA